MLTKLVTCAALLLYVIGALEVARTAAQTGGTGQASATAQTRLVGEVSAADAATGEFLVKTDDGRSVLLKAEERATIQRVPQGDAGTGNATRITLAEVAIGDRVFARGTLSEDGKTFSARQLVVAGKQAVQQVQQGQREEWARRGIVGRITAINTDKKELTINARGREGAQSVTVDASGKVKFQRYAPDSSRPADAVETSFADLRMGDQIRARGERSSDGTRFTAQEILAGSFQRTGGTITSINTAANEIVIRNEQTGQTQTIVLGQRSMLRRITPEAAQALAERRAQGTGTGGRRRQRNEQGGNATQPNNAPQPDRQQGAGNESQRRPGGGGGGGGPRGGFQEMIANLPALTINDLKKGDVVMVTGSEGTDKSRLTVMTLVTGDADFLKRMMQFQGRPNRDGQNMSPGLPSDVVGGGTGGTREQP